VKQRIRYARSADGTALAWAEAGAGVPLVKAANWLTHLEYDVESPVWSHWINFFADHFRFIRYDERGCGLTDREVADLSFERWVQDLESVVEAAGLDEPFALLGVSQGAATAIAYAERYPERVSCLILYGGYAKGWRARGDAGAAKLYNALVEITEIGWGLENPVFRELFTRRFIPEGTAEQVAWFNDLCRNTVSSQMAARLLAARSDLNVSSLLARVKAPVLVLHCSRDEVVPFAEGKELAQGLPDAQFVTLESRNHIVLKHEPAWRRVKEAVLDFMSLQRGGKSAHSADLDRLSRREREILALICEAKSNPEIAAELNLSERTVRNHASNLFKKIGVKSRAEAILYLHDELRR